MSENYTIQGGDTLSAIAAKHGISVEELKEANGIENANQIQMGATLVIPMVSQESIPENIDSIETTSVDTSAVSTEKEPWQNLEALLENDGEGATMEADRGFLGMKTGYYNYTADGSITYEELKDQLGIDRNFKLSTINPDIKGASNEDTIPEGTVLTFNEKTLPGKPIYNDNGEKVTGYEQSLVSDTIYYVVQHGDTQEGIYDNFAENKDILKGHRTADAMYGYPTNSLQPGTKVPLPKKFLGIF